MEMNFASPDSVSSGNQNDAVEMKVVEVSLFQSKDLKKMDKKSFKEGDGQINKSVPPIIGDPEAAKQIEDTTEQGGSVMNSISSGNFVISLILGGSMQQLWGMIRALQMIILTALVRTPIPAATFMFFQGCMMFA